MSNTQVNKQIEEFLSLQDFWILCRSHSRWFAMSVAVCLLIAVYYLSTTADIYTCEAAVMVKMETTRGTVAQSASGNDFNNMALVQQQTNVPNVLRQYQSLSLLTDVAYRLDSIKSQEEAKRVAQAMQRALTATLDDEQSTIINLKYQDLSPERAEKVLSTIIDAYNERWLDEKKLMAANTAHFIDDRLKLIERELKQVDDSISTFKTRHQITNLEQVSDLYLQQQTESEAEILKLSNQMYMAKYILDILKDDKSRYQLLPVHTGLSTGEAGEQIAQYNALLLRLKNNLEGTSTQNPMIMSQEKQLSEIRQNIIATVSNYVKTLQIQISTMEGYNADVKEKVTSSPDQAKRLLSVERDQKVKENLYLYLLQKKEENEISKTYTPMPTQIIDMPHGSAFPTFPNKNSVLMAALLIGVLLPAVVIFIKVSLDTSVRSKSDIESRSNLPIIGEVPFYCEGKQRQHAYSWLNKGKKAAPTSTPLVVKHGNQDEVNEAFRLIRSNLEFMTDTPLHKNVYLVTSMYASSGKTFVSMNLALALAIKNRSVLFIDGDLRRATATRTFGNMEMGLADYLGEKVDSVERLIFPHREYPSLHIIPVGSTPPNPTELLSGKRMSQLIEDIRPKYDFIIIDCPMTEMLADASIIGQHADRTLYIVRAGLFQCRQVSHLDASVESGKYKNLSIILNAVKPIVHQGYGYGYGNYYAKY
ncbi:MAG: GumC family protein [Prevotella sp.]